MVYKTSKQQIMALYMIGILLVILTGVAIGYGLYSNRIDRLNISKNGNINMYYLSNEETGIKVSIGKKCDNCSISVTPISDSIRKGILKTYDIKILDKDGNVKDVENFDITVKFPIDKELEQYTDYKIVYVENNQIIKTYSALREDENIVLKPTQLGIFGITGSILPD